MTDFRIVPKRATYRVEQLDPTGQYKLVGTWRTEDAAVSHLKRLEAEAERATNRPPAPGEVRGPPPPRK